MDFLPVTLMCLGPGFRQWQVPRHGHCVFPFPGFPLLSSYDYTALSAEFSQHPFYASAVVWF